ncbi:MAG: hypothetical protein H0X42_01695 [Solirubrobacterales bacterium]|nr:hypothetical protein [Solirubrobacterales bacterium]
MAIDPTEGRLYWTNANGPTVSYANLDGSGAAANLSTSPLVPSEPAFPALLKQPAAVAAPMISAAGSSVGSTPSCSLGSWDLIFSLTSFTAPLRATPCSG